MRTRHLIAVFVTLSLSWTVAFAYTSPGQPSGYVNDYAGMISVEDKPAIEAVLKSFHETDGGEIAVVTIPTLGGDQIEEYATSLFREWGIGQKNQNNGVLLLIAKEERAVRIEVGYGYEGRLTDALSAQIIRNEIVPMFQRGDFSGGIATGTRVIIQSIKGEYVASASSDSSTGGTLKAFALFSTFFGLGFLSIVMFLASIFGRSKSWWLGGVVGTALCYVFIKSILVAIAGGLVGLLFDFIVSRGYKNSVANGTKPPWWTGGGMGGGGGFGGSSSGSSFGGFGGGSSGGGGASGRW